ncbi:MAG: aminoglycoside phosphotransferase family protein [Acidimicrobiales bacterium]
MASADDIRLPTSLAWLREVDDGRAWLRSLPNLVAEACSRWSLTLGESYEGSYVSVVLPAERDGDSSLVLKLQFPHRESDHEAAALRAWGGDGAVRLIDDAPDLRALLVERCVPGTHLADAGAEAALPVLTDLVQRLAVPMTEPFTALADEALRWAENLETRWEQAGRPFERLLVDRALELLAALAGTQGDQVLIHQDLHGHNVLRAQREPWLAIDPKPLHGEIEFALAPIVRSYELGHSRQAVLHRLDQLTEALGVDRARARDWCFAQTVAWSIEGRTALHQHLDTARWLVTA